MGTEGNVLKTQGHGGTANGPKPVDVAAGAGRVPVVSQEPPRGPSRGPSGDAALTQQVREQGGESEVAHSCRKERPS